MSPAPLADYSALAGRSIAVVEHMLHHPYVLGVRQAQEAGARITLLMQDVDWYSHGRPWAEAPLALVDDVVHVDTTDVDAVLGAVTDAAGSPRFDAVTSFSDYHTEVAATVAQRLGLPGPNPDALRRANHKHLLRGAFGDDEGNLRHALVGDLDAALKAAADLGYPVIAKPPAEAISYGVRRCDDDDELSAAVAELSGVTSSLRGQPRTGEVLLEEYVDGVEVSVESMSFGGTTHIYGVTSKDLFGDPYYIECGHTFPVPLSEESRAELYGVVRRALASIGYDYGPCHTEVRLTDRGWRLIEANPRTPSSCMTMLVTDVTGRSPILDAWLLAVGEVPDVAPVTWTGGAAVRMLYPQATGALQRVDGVEAAAADPAVQVLLHVHEGEELMARMDNSSCVGFTYATAEDPATAAAIADDAAAKLTFVGS
ncbi:ATP-grasp domain-containing protein [uncultured Phycicoccus sp.]|uniref:ATP-grasp domain-containing protein n=1 Tax=uncultured Phycicoccus sp. TaxID=661422 RepID=UPI00262EF3F0|nr:ATP-grasp domain-containing protein [uncultured Phycicoccus sp.]